jgi:hypothetical protein
MRWILPQSSRSFSGLRSPIAGLTMKQLRALSQPSRGLSSTASRRCASVVWRAEKPICASRKGEISQRTMLFASCLFPRSLHSTLVTRPSFHLITLSALASTLGGIVRPICFAVLRLMMNSNLIGCSTGSSAGLAPFRILSTYVAARLKLSISLVE